MIFPLSYAPECVNHAKSLSKTYGFVHSDTILPRLHLTSSHLQLLTKGFKPFFVDFNDVSILKRVKQNKTQGLVKACKPHPGLKIIDATAGFGRDAFVLASMGAEVLMLERCPMLVALLKDGLDRLGVEAFDVGNLNLMQADSLEYIANLAPDNFPDVIYLDPMHPVRHKKALVKKEMQILQEILGFDADVKQLLNLAITKCKQYVVVKWPQREPPIGKPHHSIPGKTIRFDVYIYQQGKGI